MAKVMPVRISYVKFDDYFDYEYYFCKILTRRREEKNEK